MSWLFLNGTLAYKLKKPVRYPFLDFTTPRRRKHYCELELRLNQRLAGDIYRRVVALCVREDGDLSIGGTGEPVDWLVEMRQLPEDGMLDHALQSGTVDKDAIIAVADKLGSFYAKALPQRGDGYKYLSHLDKEGEINRIILLRFDDLVPRAISGPLLDRWDGLLRRLRPEIHGRIADGCIVEGHGDLRPEHVFIGPPPAAIDCLEFNRSMRLIDPYDEVNYLGLECEVLGGAWIRSLLLDTVDRHLQRRPPPELLAVYGTFRALLRARLAIAHLLDAKPSRPERWPVVARQYLAVAEREAFRVEG